MTKKPKIEKVVKINKTSDAVRNATKYYVRMVIEHGEDSAKAQDAAKYVEQLEEIENAK